MEKTVFDCYHSPEDYQARLRESHKQRKANDYEVFDFALCLGCKHFKADKNYPTVGDCLLMWEEGAYGGVDAIAVCNRFVDSLGIGLDNKVIEPSLLPAGKSA
jgi:hypothetical protein